MENYPRSAGRITQAIQLFFLEGKQGKAVSYATPKGNFLSPKAVEDALKAKEREVLTELIQSDEIARDKLQLDSLKDRYRMLIANIEDRLADLK